MGKERVSLPKVEGEVLEELGELAEKTKTFIQRNKTLDGLHSLHKKSKPLSKSPLKKLFFSGASALVRKGGKKVIKHDDLFELPRQYQTDKLWERFEKIWDIELTKPNPSLFRALRKMFLGVWLFVLFLQTIYVVCSFVIPIVMPLILDFIRDDTQEYWKGYVYTAIIIFVSLLGSLAYYRAQYRSQMIGIEIRSIFIQLVYRKILTMEQTQKTNSGQIVNLIATDAQLFADSINTFNSGVTAPIQILLATGVLWWHIGVFSLLGIGVFTLLLPLILVLGRRIGQSRALMQAMGDKRLKLVNELINGIRIIKFYAWENAFIKNITSTRNSELKAIAKLAYERTILIATMANTTVLLTIAIFVIYGLFGPNRDSFSASTAFTILSVIGNLKSPFFILPMSISFFQQYKRISDFVLLQDIPIRNQSEPGKPIIKISSGSFSWEDDLIPTLQHINIHVPEGSLHMVIGSVGSGKSTLAMSILGEVKLVSGERKVRGSIAYVPQEAWIMNASLKENILFGEEFDEEKYNKVLEFASLKQDLAQLPYGDKTEIGERGVTLSGGQRQRVSFARALYSDRDVYVFDDPFSAVDSHVGKHLFEKAVQVYLKGKTILLITNQLQYLTNSEKIYVLSDGKQTCSGSLFDLRKSSHELNKLLNSIGEIEEENIRPNNAPKLQKKKSSKFILSESGNTAILSMQTNEETKKSGLVKLNIYGFYIKAGGIAYFAVLLMTYLLSTSFYIFSSYWISNWTASNGRWNDKGSQFYMWIYVSLLISQALCTAAGVLLVVPFGQRASQVLHELMLMRVIRAPTAFFDKTPVGRIVNRFAKEISFIDMMPINVTQYLNSIFTMISVFSAMIIGSRWLILIIIPCLFIYLFAQTWYRKTAIELQRLEALSRAPVISHLAETINGTVNIRSFGMEQTFKNMNSYKADFNTIELHAQRYTQAWFGLCLDMVGQALILATLLAISFTRNYSPDSLDEGFAGIALTYLSGITFALNGLNISTVEIESRMNSVERVKEYDSIDQESAAIIPEHRPPKGWPSKGEIEFKEYSLSYRKEERVLSDISVKFEDKEKVGIVGRTGAGLGTQLKIFNKAGKSSLLQALFRMVEPSSGTILIDGVDVTKIGLYDLRSKLAIIPQDPVLFVGTLRFNLDPYDEFEDNVLWDVLQMVRLKKTVSELDGKLEEPVQEKGTNFSMGQRQLICIARALLRRSKILLMDEATASVDLTTDATIQKMVRKHFKDVTVLTIAHRLNTVMDSTKVLVLNKGSVAQFDSPGNLLDDSTGIFHSMVEATGPGAAAFLWKIAKGEISLVDALRNEAEEISKSSYSFYMNVRKQLDLPDYETLDSNHPHHFHHMHGAKYRIKMEKPKRKKKKNQKHK